MTVDPTSFPRGAVRRFERERENLTILRLHISIASEEYYTYRSLITSLKNQCSNLNSIMTKTSIMLRLHISIKAEEYYSYRSLIRQEHRSKINVRI